MHQISFFLSFFEAIAMHEFVNRNISPFIYGFDTMPDILVDLVAAIVGIGMLTLARINRIGSILHVQKWRTSL